MQTSMNLQLNYQLWERKMSKGKQLKGHFANEIRFSNIWFPKPQKNVGG